MYADYSNAFPIGSLGLVYLPTCCIENQPNVGRYIDIPYMDPMGLHFSSLWQVWHNLLATKNMFGLKYSPQMASRMFFLGGKCKDFTSI